MKSNFRMRSEVKFLVGLMMTLLTYPMTVFAVAEATKQKQIITLPLSSISPKVDGKMDRSEYADAVILGGSFRGWEYSPRPQSPTVYLKRTQNRLYVMYDNPLKEGERPSMSGAVPDNSGICMSNAVELFFLPHLPDGELLHYIQFIGNARNCIYDALTRPEVGVTYVAEYNRPWLFNNSIIPGHWYSEISTKFSDVDITDTKDGEYFDFDFGRDGGTGPHGVHSYTMAYHTIQNGAGVKIVFDKNAPVVQWHSFGDFENNIFNPRLVLKSTGKKETFTVDYLITEDTLQKDKTYKEVFSKTVRVDLEANGEKEINLNHKLPKGGKGIVHYTIKSQKGKILFYRTIPFTCNQQAKDLYDKSEPQPLVVGAKMAPSYGRIGVTADIIEYSGDKSKVAVQVEVHKKGVKKALSTLTLDQFKLDYATGVLEVGPLTKGEYVVNFKMIDKKSGVALGPKEQVKLKRVIYEWENNKLGYSETPPEPWSPVQLFGKNIHVWGRRYVLAGMGLPGNIYAMQPNPTRGKVVEDVLAAPVGVRIMSEGKEQVWEQQSFRFTHHDKNKVEVSGEGVANFIDLSLKGTLEYDGFYKIDLTLTPTSDKKVDSITIEIPVPTKMAGLFHSVGENMRANKTFADFSDKTDGVIWDSKSAARNAVIKGNFLPVVWIGNEDRGLSWMCDNAHTWKITHDKPCLDVVRRGDQTIFRMHILNRPGKIKKTIHVVFSLQATPVRPRPAGSSWKQKEWYGWSQFDKPLLWDKCFEPYKQGKGYRWLRTEKAKKNDIWWRYGCFNSDRISPSDSSYGQMIKDFGGEWYCDSIFMKYQNKSHQDFELWAYKQWHDIGGMDGLYFDNTFPAPSINLLNKTALKDDEGNLVPGYGLMNYREYLKRLRVMLLSFGSAPVMMAHITDTPIPGYLGFCDFWLDGENGGYPSKGMKNPDFIDRWYNKTGLANMRITMGQQWGTMPRYLYSWGIEPTHAVLGMFDLDNRYLAMGKKPFHDFGRDKEDIKFIPYWSNNQAAKVVKGGPDVFLTVWQRPGRSRVLISNFSNEARMVSVSLDTKRLVLSDDAQAMDEREGSELDFSNNIVKNIYVGRHNYAAIIIAEKGLYSPLPKSFGDVLKPRKNLWIENFCDDFSSIKKNWIQNASPYTSFATKDHRVESPVFSLMSGYLKIRTSSCIYANLKQKFNQDNCSVQIKVRDYLGNYMSGYGAGLHLYWKNGSSVHLTAGPGRGSEKIKNHFSAWSVVNNKKEQKYGDMITAVNWIKIELAQGKIRFYTSNYGDQWSLLLERDREGLEGAAELLTIGHGKDKDIYHERYTFDSFFDDLILAKLK